MNRFRLLAFGLLLTASLTQCRKATTDTAGRTDLQQCDLPYVQQQIAGTWKLSAITGGLCGSCDHPFAAGSYLTLAANRVTFGNAAQGVTEDGPITWQPADLFGGGYYFAGPSGNGYLPVEIREGVLLLQQYANDGVTYHYVR
ncbi:MAG: hypothetical protein EOP49_04580 [Sphingobacteriales bacterium]|nr:MAG: hypothetical protein EOP49_04580 [Sphingobacteriales bacterium]